LDSFCLPRVPSAGAADTPVFEPAEQEEGFFVCIGCNALKSLNPEK
jgi:hypothetical protein